MTEVSESDRYGPYNACLCSPFSSERDSTRYAFGEGFIEVMLRFFTEKRDVGGLYAKARSGSSRISLASIALMKKFKTQKLSWTQRQIKLRSAQSRFYIAYPIEDI